MVSGFWHGANWTFIVWGAFHALLFMPLLLSGRNRKNTDSIAHAKLLPNFKETTQMLFTFLLVVLGWIFFRAPDLSVAFDYIASIFSTTLFEMPTVKISSIGVLIGFMLLVEWIQREQKHGLSHIERLIVNEPLRWFIYMVLILIIIRFGGKSETFIYFQF